MKKKQRTHLLAAAGALLLGAPASATLIQPTYLPADSTPDSYLAGTPDKLVDNSGMIVDVVSGTSLADAIAATHIFNGGFAESWVTNDPPPGGGDYYAESGIVPVLVFDLGQDLEILDLFFWQYQNNGGGGALIGNQVKDIEVRFNTAADGSSTFSGTPFAITDIQNSIQTGQANIGQQFTLPAPTVARYVQLTITDNYFGQPGITGGGDRVGIGEFRVNVAADPEIVVPATFDISGNLAPTAYQVPISNNGATLDLEITDIQIAGADAAFFTVDTAASPGSPLSIVAGGNANIEFTFDPNGTTGPFSAELVITSNDPFASPSTIPLVGTVRDPWISAPDLVDVGGLAADAPETFTVTIENLGATNNLEVSGALPTGTDASFFTVDTDLTTPLVIAPGTTADLDLTFDPDGFYDTFSAVLEITSNDLDAPTVSVNLTAELIRDPLIDAPASVRTGPVTYTGTPISIPVEITNLGDAADLTLPSTPIFFGDPGFSVASFDTPIAPAASGEITVEFTPPVGEFGIFSADLDIESNDPGQPFTTVELSVEILPPAAPGGLVAWWPLDSSVDPGNEVQNGLDGNVVGTGTLTDAAGANAFTGGSLDFDGAVTLTVPQNAALNPESYTVTLWAQPDSIAGHLSPITSRFDEAGVNGDTHGYILYILPNGQWSYWTGAEQSFGWDTVTGDLATVSTWQHIAISYDAATMTKTLYINGVAMPPVVLTTPPSRNLGRDLHIGSGSDFGGSFVFDGRLDDVAVFNTALSPADINTIRAFGVDGFVNGVTDPYATWENANGIAGAGLETDSDGDGVANGIEFVIGGDPSGPDSDSNALLPTSVLETDDLVFTFRRTSESIPYAPFVEYGSDLAGWTTAVDGADGVSITETPDGFGPGVDQVVVRIPRALAQDSKLFARLVVTAPVVP